MKNIDIDGLPNFHGLTTKDPNTFLFEFELFFRTYDYLLDSKKLKLFHYTFIYSTLRWIMSLGENIIESWDE